MYLQKLEINGFKSFAKKTIFEFDKGVTAVVGPNGSGKSNVAEAIRWVMGEQSTKSLRSKKSTDVIFSGSDKASRLGMAEVSLFFDNSDGSAAIDFAEVVITRRIHRDGRGEYFINNKASRLQDILLLLAQINLSSKTYSVISQGMVDMILNISASERKDFFEEASGVKPLQIKKNDAARKLNSAQENIQTIEIQLAEISPRLRSLTRQVKKLDDRMEIDNKLRDLQYHYFGETFFSLTTEHESLKKREQEYVHKTQALEKTVKSQQQQMYELTRESSHSSDFSKLQQLYQETLEKKTSLKEQELELKSFLIQSSKKSTTTSVPVRVVRDVYHQWETHREALQDLSHRAKAITEVSELSDWHTEHDAHVQKLDALFGPLKSHIQDTSTSHDAEEKKLKDIAEQIRSLDTKLKDIQKDITKLTQQEKEEKSKIWDTQNALQETQGKLNELNNQLSTTRISLARTETRKADLEAEVSEEIGPEFLNRISEWKPGDSGHASDTDSLRQEIHKLKHQLELIGGIDPEVRSEHKDTKERHDFLGGQLSDLTTSIEHLQTIITDLDATIVRQFNESFKKINEQFQKFFKILFKGGRADLKLITGSVEGGDDEDEEKKQVNKEEIVGVDITAVPPGKKLSTITALSGGERALTSIALIAAIIANNPAPFVVLDEVDAALDEANSMRFAEIVGELSSQTQFVVITHNRATMEQAQILYGVTMGDDGISKLLSLKLEAASKYTNR